MLQAGFLLNVLPDAFEFFANLDCYFDFFFIIFFLKINIRKMQAAKTKFKPCQIF